MAKPGVMFYFDVRPCIKRLDAAEKGRLFEAILDYGEFGVVPELDGALGVAWDFIQPKLDRDSGRYDRQVEQRKYAVFSRELSKRGLEKIDFETWKGLSDIERDRLMSDDTVRYPTSTSNPNLQLQPTTSTPTGVAKQVAKPPRSRFAPPTVDQVKAYCSENGYTLDADRFVDYYASNGWRVGKNPMKDWKAAVRNWATKEKGNPGKPHYESGIDRLARLYQEEFGA